MSWGVGTLRGRPALWAGSWGSSASDFRHLSFRSQSQGHLDVLGPTLSCRKPKPSRRSEGSSQRGETEATGEASWAPAPHTTNSSYPHCCAFLSTWSSSSLRSINLQAGCLVSVLLSFSSGSLTEGGATSPLPPQQGPATSTPHGKAMGCSVGPLQGAKGLPDARPQGTKWRSWQSGHPPGGKLRLRESLEPNRPNSDRARTQSSFSYQESQQVLLHGPPTAQSCSAPLSVN